MTGADVVVIAGWQPTTAELLADARDAQKHHDEMIRAFATHEPRIKVDRGTAIAWLAPNGDRGIALPSGQATGACGSCGHDPACGHASITVDGVETPLCHTYDHSCYIAAGQSTASNRCSEVWYGKSEGGEVVDDGAESGPHTLPATVATPALPAAGHGLRCSCAGCLASRAALRVATIRDALRPKNGPSGAWADRNWDGALAEFPGQTHDDTMER